jgi:hypothetical protein
MSSLFRKSLTAIHSLAVCLIVLCQVAGGQTVASKSKPIPVCEVAERPDQFNSTIVSIRGLVLFGSEEFKFSAQECQNRKIDDIWLEYGRGPKNQPTTWCCGDPTPRDSLRLIEDRNFREFDRKLTAHKGREKYLYDVTATLSGRFEAVPPCAGDASARCCPGGGFGHFGFSCARLVIQAVSDVVAKPR